MKEKRVSHTAVSKARLLQTAKLILPKYSNYSVLSRLPNLELFSLPKGECVEKLHGNSNVGLEGSQSQLSAVSCTFPS